MKRTASLLSVLCLAAGLSGIAGGARAAIISLVPAAPTVSAGSSFVIDVFISDLGDLAAPSVAGFDLEVLYDPAVLTATGVTFGDPILGDQLDLFGLGFPFTGTDLATPGIAAFDELSLNSTADLDGNQPGAFVLARIDFTALVATAPGSPSPVSVDPATALVIDGPGDPIDLQFVDAAVTVVDAPATVPAPAPLALMLTALGAAVCRRRCVLRPV